MNLNDLKIPNADGEDQALQDFSGRQGDTTVLFRNLEQELVKQISRYDLIVGCVAWLSSQTILSALSKKQSSLVVQKEDFLRPDYRDKKGKDGLFKSYSGLKCGLTRFSLPGIGGSLSMASDPSLSPIRCVGNHNSEKKLVHPRMHNKFLVFCSIEGEYPESIVAKAVWTGSFNMTFNASNSFENAVLLEQPQIAERYLNEFVQIYALSEPLDWETEWVEPEYRIGT